MTQRFLVLFSLFTIWTVTNAQFLYNYEEDHADNAPPSEEYDMSAYKYNSPSAVEKHFLESQRTAPAPREPEVAYRRYRPRPEPENIQYQPASQPPQRNYYAEPEAFDDNYDPEPEYIPEPPPPPRRRTTRRRKTIIRQSKPEEIVEPPKYFGPSAFENIGLGQAPAGIFVPHDSLLNLLKDDTQTRTQPRHVGYVSSQHTPAVIRSTQQTVRDVTPSPFFVEPPSQSFSSFVQPVEYQRNQNNEQFYPEEPVQEVVQPPQPVYRPSSQEIQQDVYRQERRASHRRPIQQSQNVRSHRRRQRPAIQHIPQPQVVHEVPPPEPVYDTRATEIFENDVQRERSPRRNPENAPRRRTRIQEIAVTPAPQARQLTRPTFKPARLAIAELPDDTDEDGIPGAAGQDYPTLHVIPKTSFQCSKQPHNGYYADLETSCQVVHMCHSGGVQSSFLCPNGTIFSQEKFSCQWWYKVDCQNSPRFYSINDSLYKVPPKSKK